MIEYLLNHKKYLIGALVVIFVLTFISNNIINSKRHETDRIESKVVTQSTDKELKNNKSTDKQEFNISLGGVKLDDPNIPVDSSFGDIIRKEKRGNYLVYIFKDAGIIMRNSNNSGEFRVAMMWTRSSKQGTEHNIKVGDSEKIVIDTYGKNFTSIKKSQIVFTEYDASYVRHIANEKEEKISAKLRFAFQKDKVSLIVVGNNDLIEAFDRGDFGIDSSPQNNTEKEIALKAFNTYWENLDKRDFRSAYSLLTVKVQNQMGVFEDYLHGYDEMLENKVTKMSPHGEPQNNKLDVDYEIQAKDRIQGKIKVQIFSGTATLIKEGDTWKIDALHAKLLKSFYEK